MKRFGAISDIHACEDSLRAVLKHISDCGIDQILCLGDIVGYGPDPAACVEEVRASVSVSVLGNHDMMATNEELSLEGLAEEISRPLIRAREELDEAQIDWLWDLPLVARGPGFELSHGSLDHPDLFVHLDGQREIERHFQSQQENLSFFGHTHIPSVYHRAPDGHIRVAKGIGQFALTEPGSYAVGVGSVGFPRDDDPRACWVEIESDSRTITFHRLEVDWRRRNDRLRQLLDSESKAGS
jgi:predicted phosphodiesterase